MALQEFARTVFHDAIVGEQRRQRRQIHDVKRAAVLYQHVGDCLAIRQSPIRLFAHDQCFFTEYTLPR